MRQRHGRHAPAEALEHLQRIEKAALHIGFEVLEKVLTRQADRERLWRPFDLVDIVWYQHLDGAWVEAVMTGHRLQKMSAVIDATGDRPRMVERPGQGQNPT